MATHTFGTDVSPAQYVETPDPDNPGQVKRPPAGTELLVKDSATLADLDPISTDAYGYWTYSTTDVPGILVSGDNGGTWVGPLYSREYTDASMASATSTLDAALSAETAAQAAAADAASSRQAAEDAAASLAGAVAGAIQVIGGGTTPIYALDAGVTPPSTLPEDSLVIVRQAT